MAELGPQPDFDVIEAALRTLAIETPKLFQHILDPLGSIEVRLAAFEIRQGAIEARQAIVEERQDAVEGRPDALEG